MKKLILFIPLLTAITYQPAQAQSYYYEHAGQGAHDYVIIDGERYARIPQQPAPRVEIPRYELQRQAEPRYELRRVDEPRYETRRVIETQPRYTKEPPHLKIAWDVKPYIGIDVGTTDFSFSESDEVNLDEAYNTKPKFWGVVAGLKFNPYLGIEAFYQKSGDDTKKYNAATEFSYGSIKTSMNYKAYGADLLGYLPLTDSLEMVLGLGLAQYKFGGSVKMDVINTSVNYVYHSNEKISADSMAGRFGLGLQYNINEHWAVRATGRYVKFFDDDEFEKMIELSLGLRYFF